MEPGFQSPKTTIVKRVKKYAVLALMVVGGLFVVLALFVILGVASFTGLGSQGFSSAPSAPGAPGVSPDYSRSTSGLADMEQAVSDESFMPSPMPVPTSYVPNLEQYETTDYRASARTRDFDEACTLLRNLKTDDDIDFKNLSVNTNYCTATFFTKPEKVSVVLDQLQEISGVEISQTTESVTRRREQLQTESDVLRQQLASVERTLADAERQYTEITEVARASNDAAALTRAIRDKLSTIETLDQKRINLLSRLRSMSQQAADLDERIGVVAFTATFYRSFPVDADKKSRQWETAWKELSDAFTVFLIGFSAYLGIFILKIVQYAVYALVLLLLVRFGSKFVRRIWKL